MRHVPRDDYYVTMWNFFKPFYDTPKKAKRAIRRYRDLGCNSGTMMSSMIDHEAYLKSLKPMGLTFGYKGIKTQGASPFKENNFPFYLMNILRPIYLDWNKGKPAFKKLYGKFSKTRDRKLFVRTPCVNDPKVIVAMDAYTRRMMEILRDEDMLDLCHYYDLRDEPSVTSFILASDYCFCEHCMAKLRAKLKVTYGGLRGVNRAWGTAFKKWDDVYPLTSQEMLERREAGDFNFASWADHRDFQNDSFRDVLLHGMAVIKEYDPDAMVGVCGTQCPSVFGGYDFSKLAPPMDFIEAYDFGCSLDILRSLRRDQSVPLMPTSFYAPDRASMLNVRLWTYLYQGGGNSGTIIWQSNALFDPKTEGVKPLKSTPNFGDMLAELRSGAPKLLQRSKEQSSPVAIHYSHASVNADFALSCPPRWRSVASWEDDKGAIYPTRDAWFAILEDLGLRPVFVSSQQIEAGELEKRKFKLLILPRSVAVSDAEAKAMKRFVRNGGVLAADSFPGRMDEHCRDREAGCLDNVFGVKRLEKDNYFCTLENVNWYRDWKGKDVGGRRRFDVGHVENLLKPKKGTVSMGRTEVADSPVGVVNTVGKGKTILFNATPMGYMAGRTKGLGSTMRDFFGSCVEMAKVKPELVVGKPGDAARPLPGLGIFPFRHGGNRYFGVAPDLNVSQDVLGEMQMDAGGGQGKVSVTFPVAGHIYDVRKGEYLGKGEQVDLHLGTFDAPLFAVMKTKAKSMALAFKGKKASAKLGVTGGKPSERVFRFDLLNKSGKRLLDAGANVVARNGKATWTPDKALPKKGKLVCRDVATGVSAHVRLM
jgi:glycosyl hydrolase family 42 (putative beta-galactosidase)